MFENRRQTPIHSRPKRLEISALVSEKQTGLPCGQNLISGLVITW